MGRLYKEMLNISVTNMRRSMYTFFSGYQEKVQ